MRRNLLLCLSVLLSAGAAAAQAAGSTGGFSTLETIHIGPGSSSAKPPAAAAKINSRSWHFYPSCPVAMQAMQGAGGGLLAARDGKPSERQPTQRIRLVMLQNKSGKIAGATVVVHGLSLKARFQTVEGDEPAEISRRLDVGVVGGDAPDESATDLVLEGFTSVRSIDLKSLTFADGSTWTSSDHVCRAVPDLMMRIAAR